jgi:hypothetical protein
MNTTPTSVTSLRTAGLLLLAFAGAGLGQIGSPAAGLASLYGRPTLVETNDAGIEMVSYATRDRFTVTAFGRDGVALRVIYRKNGLAGDDVSRLLDLNRGGAAWALWEPPFPAGQNGPETIWMRSDDAAMAELKDSELSITAAEWNRLPPADKTAASPGPVASNAAPAVAAPAPVAAEPPPPRPARPPKPAALPAPGEDRARALTLLGPPQGELVTGRKSVLQYPWGQVLLKDGRIVQID